MAFTFTASATIKPSGATASSSSSASAQPAATPAISTMTPVQRVSGAVQSLIQGAALAVAPQATLRKRLTDNCPGMSSAQVDATVARGTAAVESQVAACVAANANTTGATYAASMKALYERQRRLQEKCGLTADAALVIAKQGVAATESRVAGCSAGYTAPTTALAATRRPWWPYALAGGVVAATAAYFVWRK